MKVYNIKNIPDIIDKINNIANELKIDIAYKFNSKNCINIKLNLGSSKDYQRTGFMYSDNLKRYNKVNAVCWHGFRDFLKKLYEISDNIRVITATKSSQTIYTNAADFYNTCENTGYNNIGSIVNPMYFKNACLCKGVE